MKKSIVKSKSTATNKNKSVKTKTTKSVKIATKKIKVATPAPAKKKVIKSAGVITKIDKEFNDLIDKVNQNNKNKMNVTHAPAAPRRKEKFVDPAIQFKLESARGILRKPNGDTDYSLPTIKQFNKAIAENRLTGSPIVEKE